MRKSFAYFGGNLSYGKNADNGRTDTQKLRFITAAWLAIAVMAPPALAQSQDQRAARGDHAPVKYTITSHAVNLSPLTVYGQKLSLPAVLQMVKLQQIKAALHRPYRLLSENLDKLVCRRGTNLRHRPILFCKTNCVQWMQSVAVGGQNATFVGYDQCKYALRVTRGAKAVKSLQRSSYMAAWVDSHRFNLVQLYKRLQELPPADASYTMRVSDHGKLAAEFVFKKGVLVHAYLSKEAKAKLAAEKR